MRKIVIIGSGFSGLSAACFMARAGMDVTVIEKHDSPGGRAREFKADGFTFDMGPSWYWMPDVFERFFASFGKKVSDYYELERLDPSYRIYWPQHKMDVPADYQELRMMFEKMEPGAAIKLDQFMKEAAYKYEVGMNKLVHRPGRSLTEFMDLDLITGVFRLDVFASMKKHIARYFKNPQLQQMMEFPVLFLGALARNTPALYSLMNYADMKLGTWYPKGGLYKVVEAMFSLAKELGVKFRFAERAVEIIMQDEKTSGVLTEGNDLLRHTYSADVVIGAADYHFIETNLLPTGYRSYSDAYWNSRLMAPSCLLYYVGLNKKLKNLLHHSLFFDTDFNVHGDEIYVSKQWPVDPLFYVCTSSVTDPLAAPPGCENLFFLVPVSAGLQGDTKELRERYFQQILERFERNTGESVRDAIVFKRSYSIADFKEDYHSFKGNAYGLANTLRQTAILKPSCRSNKIKNLFYCGQLTVPGPGVPPSLISGEVVANEVVKYLH